MEERSEQRRPIRTRRRKLTKWQRFWKRYGPTVEFLGICALLLAVLIFVGVKLVGMLTGPGQPEETIAATKATEEPSTEAPTDPPTQPPPKYPIQGKGGVIYLTFDDGPGKDTPRLLEILDKYDAKATFFFVNTGYASTITQVAEAGHTLAMHTATHNFSQIYASEEAYYNDLYKIQAVIEQYSGQSPNFLRFPGGSSNTVSRNYNTGIMTRLTKLVEEQGYIYFDWNVDSKDAGGATTADEVAWNVIEGCSTRTAPVVLLHDIHSYTVDAIEDILIWGLENGYTFEGLTADSPTCHHGLNN